MEEIFREKLLDKSDSSSIYKLVMLAIKRGIEIADGAPKLVDLPEGVKSVTAALAEIIQGKVKYKVIKDKNE